MRLTESDLPRAVQIISGWLASSRSAVAFTGAGISTESGIPDFRSPGGVWTKFRTVYFDEFCDSADARYEYWQQKAEAQRDFAAAVPNITHQTLTAWESSGRLRGVITQNIDGLHTEAGSQQVLELHGTARVIACLDCAWRGPAEIWVQRFLDDDRVPDCPDCAGRLKHATVSFGQALPEGVLRMAAMWAGEADLFLTLGSSLVVEPAASLPRIARQAGARLVILNRDPTPLDRSADLVVNAPLGAFFQALRNAQSVDPV
jgi:NAD-dependent deacetylase